MAATRTVGAWRPAPRPAGLIHPAGRGAPGAQSAGRSVTGRQDVKTTDGAEPLREAIARLAASEPGQGRWPLIRMGDRKSISRYVRRAVFMRDGRRCLSCGVTLTLRTAQLDHIVPWSAGGSDESANLRILCEPCNSDRSNWHGSLDTWAARRPPVTFYCVSCIHLDEYGDEVLEPSPVTSDMVAAFCAQCGLVSRTWPEEVW